MKKNYPSKHISSIIENLFSGKILNIFWKTEKKLWFWVFSILQALKRAH
jgi:hypothetical protein